MGDKLLSKILKPYTIGAAIVILAAIGGLFYYNRYAAAIGGGAFLLYLVFILVIHRHQRAWVNHYLESIEDEIEDTLRYSVKNHPLALCVVNSEGRIALSNGKFKEIFPSAQILKTEIETLTGFRQWELMPDEEKRTKKLEVDGRTYSLIPLFLNRDVSKSVMLYFVDVTDFEKLKVRYNEEKKCIAYLIVDNYDALLSKSPDSRRSAIASSIESVVRKWAEGIDAALLRIRSDRYYLIFDKKHFKGITDNKFSILDEVRGIQTDAEFPVSLSIGVGVGGGTPNQGEEFASFALDLALGRGGDQAVVKSGSQVTYYGGKVQVIERRNKGKSRVMAHALKQLITQSSRVMIMGHRNPDMDAFGAAVGVYRIAFAHHTDAYIVIDAYNHSLSEVYDRAVGSGSYQFLSSAEALKIVDRDTLLVVVDTHIPGFVECRELLGKTDRMVIIDHHRKMEGFIDNATLTFMEPNASSTSELVTEILQYDDSVKKINKLEAELLLAGIFVDTNSFSVKTGSRTFEAASWLRNNGGDSTAVRRLLQNDMEDFRQRASIISNAEFDKNGVAISYSEGEHVNAQVVIAQAADELLDIKGIRASFVVAETAEGIAISSRSLGDVNVQVLMEKFGGGGHLTMAAAQVEGTTKEEVIKTLKRYIKEID
jgi:c-di-AMP phosphodiesterase-like protein